jgi:hypothetical protein
MTLTRATARAHDGRPPMSLRLLAQALRQRSRGAPPRLAQRRLARLLSKPSHTRADELER